MESRRPLAHPSGNSFASRSGSAGVSISRLGFDRTLVPRLWFCVCPAGTSDNSPPIHRWDRAANEPKSPGGAKDIPHASSVPSSWSRFVGVPPLFRFVGPSSLWRHVGNLFRPCRDSSCRPVSCPTVETVGYCRASLTGRRPLFASSLCLDNTIRRVPAWREPRPSAVNTIGCANFRYL